MDRLNENELITACRMCNAVQLPLTPETLNVILDITELIKTKGNTASMQDLDNIVLKYTQQNINDQQNEPHESGKPV